MEKIQRPFSLQCPVHSPNVVGMLNVDLDAKKIGYCFECIAENGGDATNLKTVPGYLKDNSSFYEKCRQRAQSVGEPPAKYIEELSKKGERLEKFSKHIDQEKAKVVKRFEDIRKAVIQIIDEKEKECLRLLDKEILDLSESYIKYDKLITMGWPKPSDVQNLYPEIDQLKQRMSQIESIDQLKAFMSGIQEDIQIQNLYFKDENSISQIQKAADQLISCLNLPDSTLSKIKSNILNPENIDNLMNDFMKGFIQQEVRVENSIASRTRKVSIPESKIIVDDQFETLRDWLPQGYKFDLKLLFRGSVDGMSAEKFHEKCDDKGATITLIKCRFDGALSPRTIGGFIDQSWYSNNCSSTSKEAFLFSLAEQSHHSVKCPILEPHSGNAFYGHPNFGPIFGSGHDLYLAKDFKTGRVVPKSYSNTVALMNGNLDAFNVEEVEVFQVL